MGPGFDSRDEHHMVLPNHGCLVSAISKSLLLVTFEQPIDSNKVAKKK